MGISGVIVEAVNEQSVEKLAELRQKIDKLAPPSLHKKDKTSAILPRLSPETPEPQGEEEEEEEEEDE
jgi:hypothetical protein